ncbi:elongation factor 1-beta [Candidatus Woesearchaeota archaeon]|nr:elongation factor 1-beta [Candidatus Woesearchaeota archaeon]
MANAVVTIKVMPESPEVNLDELESKVKEKIVEFAGEGDMKVTVEPVAFGLKAINIIFVMDEAKGSTEPLEKAVAEIEGVSSMEVTDVRRAVG